MNTIVSLTQGHDIISTTYLRPLMRTTSGTMIQVHMNLVCDVEWIEKRQYFNITHLNRPAAASTLYLIPGPDIADQFPHNVEVCMRWVVSSQKSVTHFAYAFELVATQKLNHGHHPFTSGGAAHH